VRSFIVAALLGAAATLPAGAQTDTTVIRAVTGPSDPSTSLAFADKMGYFKRAGLNVELIKGATTSTMAAAVAGGSEDVGQGSGLGAVQIIAKGLPLTIIGNQAMYNADKPDVALLVLNGSPIKTAKDMNGKTLSGVALQDLNSVSTAMWVDQHGGDSTGLKFVEMPASATLAALQQHRIDAATVYEPFYSQYLASGDVRVLGYPYEAISKHFSDAVIYARTAWVAEHSALVGRFLAALNEANAYVVAHEAEGDAVMAQFAGLDPKTATSIHHPERVVAIAPGDLQPVIDAAARVKLIPKAFPAAEIICSCALKH
jgi:NitT/TauT family transport system substrate-binding protein